MFGVMTYLIEVNHHIPLQPLATLDIFQGQGEVDPSGVGDVQIVGVVLVPLLHSCKHLVLICADNMHVLGKGKRGRGRLLRELCAAISSGTQVTGEQQGIYLGWNLIGNSVDITAEFYHCIVYSHCKRVIPSRNILHQLSSANFSKQ